MKHGTKWLSIWLLILMGCHNDYTKKIDSVNTPKLELDFDVANLFMYEADIIKKAPALSNNKLAFNLYKEMKGKQNITYSPFSISLALAMLYAGSNDETENTMKNVLAFGDNTIDFHKSYGEFANILSRKDRNANNATLKISNVQWLQKDYPILASYKDLLKDAYRALPVQLDFLQDPSLATKIINKTISEQTNGEIEELLKEDLEKHTKIVLTNALYFNAKWQDEFDEARTRNGDFFTKDGSNKEVLYMRQIDYFPYSEDELKQVLMLPYEDQEFAAIFVLPKEGKMATIESTLDHENFDDMLNRLKTNKIDIRLPKFSQRTSFNMNSILSSLGLGIIFDSRADLSKINGIAIGNDRLFISDIIHEAVVKISEESTMAAAATAINMAPTMAAGPQNRPKPPIIFYATRPFMFYIVHKPSHTILFMGRIDNPNLN